MIPDIKLTRLGLFENFFTNIHYLRPRKYLPTCGVHDILGAFTINCVLDKLLSRHVAFENGEVFINHEIAKG